MFIYCFDSNEKDKLINKGMKFIKEENMGEQKAYVFLYDKNIKLEFDDKKLILSNRMNY